MTSLKKTKSFGVETSMKKASLVLIPVPYEATASYLPGTSKGPSLIKEASNQLDFFSPSFKKSYNEKIHFLEEDALISRLGKEAKAWAEKLRSEAGEDFKKEDLSEEGKKLAQSLDQAGESLRDWVYETSSSVIAEGKIPALVGGEHSVSEGLIKKVLEIYKGDVGVLHIDAHADLRSSYEAMEFSHASIMHRVLNLKPELKKLVSVGVRDLCEEEWERIKRDKKITCFFDEDIATRLFEGESWKAVAEEIVDSLPSNIHISFDVDGLSFTYAPGTGTPVPGGLSFHKVQYLFKLLRGKKKKVLSFDLVETAGDEWNGNVSARLIYEMAGLALFS